MAQTTSVSQYHKKWVLVKCTHFKNKTSKISKKTFHIKHLKGKTCYKLKPMTSWFFKYKYTPIIINRLFALKNFKINIISTSGLHIKYLYSMPQKKICYKLKPMTNNWLKNLGSSKKRLFHILKIFSLKKRTLNFISKHFNASH